MASSFNRRARRAAGKNAAPSSAPSCPLLIEYRPLTLSDMIPGFAYEPDLMLFRIVMAPVFGEQGNEAGVYDVPLGVPPAYREPTEHNIHVVLGLIEATDVDAARAIANIKEMARRPPSREWFLLRDENRGRRGDARRQRPNRQSNAPRT